MIKAKYGGICLKSVCMDCTLRLLSENKEKEGGSKGEKEGKKKILIICFTDGVLVRIVLL